MPSTRIAVTAALAGLVMALALPLRAHELPLGDGKISTAPKVGYLMSCVQHWRRAPMHGGPWIQGDNWNPAQKPQVEGHVAWPTQRIAITVKGDERIISANNLPDHTTGVFPIQPSDPAYRYDHNPNAIGARDILLHLPLNPKPAKAPSCVPMGMIGFSTDGVAIYNAVDDGGVDAAAHEMQDHCNGHPQHVGQYHYHSPSPCMPNEMTSGLVGYALDGFGIYGMKDRATGRILHDADLDACHGTTSPVIWNGKLVTMYHYVLTMEYPYTVGCFRGTPVSADFKPQQVRQMTSGGMAQGQPGPHRGQALARAARILGISTSALRRALGPPPPDLQAAARTLDIPVDKLRAALREARGAQP